MKKYIITISIAATTVIGIGIGLGVAFKRKPMSIHELLTNTSVTKPMWFGDAEHPFAPFTMYFHHIQHPFTPHTPSATTEAEKHYQDLTDEGHQDVDHDNQLKYNY